MGFLDNSGDIILDAVLTDHGRKLLAKGDGSFQITKFALADDEINYTLYNNSHSSGSAYYDIEIFKHLFWKLSLTMLVLLRASWFLIAQ